MVDAAEAMFGRSMGSMQVFLCVGKAASWSCRFFSWVLELGLAFFSKSTAVKLEKIPQPVVGVPLVPQRFVHDVGDVEVPIDDDARHAPGCPPPLVWWGGIFRELHGKQYFFYPPGGFLIGKPPGL